MVVRTEAECTEAEIAALVRAMSERKLTRAHLEIGAAAGVTLNRVVHPASERPKIHRSAVFARHANYRGRRRDGCRAKARSGEPESGYGILAEATVRQLDVDMVPLAAQAPSRLLEGVWRTLSKSQILRPRTLDGDEEGLLQKLTHVCPASEIRPDMTQERSVLSSNVPQHEVMGATLRRRPIAIQGEDAEDRVCPDFGPLARWMRIQSAFADGADAGIRRRSETRSDRSGEGDDLRRRSGRDQGRASPRLHLAAPRGQNARRRDGLLWRSQNNRGRRAPGKH